LFWVRKIICEKAYERLFLALFAVQTGKKKISWKSVKICEFNWIHANSRELTRKSVKFREFTRIHAKKCEFGSTVY
jgi:hypothetical protein